MPQPEENAKWELPEPLRITDPKVAERAAQEQSELAKKVNNPFARLSPLEAERAAAIRHEIEARKALQSVSDPQAVILLRGRLAQSLASQGRFQEAAEVEARDEYQAEYQATHEALTGDAIRCQCLPHNFVHEGQKRRASQAFVKRQVWDVQLGQFVNLMRCNSCGAQWVER